MFSIISFYTDIDVDKPYEKAAKRLIKNCESLNLPYVIKALPSTGDWLQNTRMKPKFILEMLKERQSPVLWVDVDTEIIDIPDKCAQFSSERITVERGSSRPFLVRAIYAPATSKATVFLEEWANKCAQTKECVGDHTVAIDVWKDPRFHDTVLIIKKTQWNSENKQAFVFNGTPSAARAAGYKKAHRYRKIAQQNKKKTEGQK